MSDIDVSIIIVNWNTCNILRGCLNSLYQETHGIVYEVIVVDNASTDNSSEMVQSEFSWVFLLKNTKNQGFAKANNQGMEIAKGRYFLLLNSDTIILNGAIQKTVQFADRHKETGVVGCRVLNPDKTLQMTCFMYPSLLNMLLAATYLYKLFPRSKFFGREQMTWWDRDDQREVEVVTGCYLLVRKKAIEQVGMMDDSFFMYAEETDWCFRFKEAGWKCFFMPDAEIVHLGGQSTQQVKVAMMIQLRKSILKFINKHYGVFHYLIGSVFIIMFFILRIPYWMVVAISRSKRERALEMLKAYCQGSWSILNGK